MHNKERVARLAIGRIVNGQFVPGVAIAILEYVESDFIKKYPDSQRTIKFLNNAFHLSIISQNFVECKQYLKKKD